MNKHFPAHDPYAVHNHHYANPRPTLSTARDPLKDLQGETEAEVVEEEVDDGDDDTDQQTDHGDQDDQDDQDNQGDQGDDDEEEELVAPAPNMTGVIAK
jgi:hypothetical protein